MPNKDPEKRREAAEKYRLNNPDKVKASAFKHYQNNKQKINYRLRDRYEMDPNFREQRLATNKRWREKIKNTK